jgi:DNA-binding NtrC family response regulator
MPKGINIMTSQNKALKIFIVEDNPFYSALLSQHLEKYTTNISAFEHSSGCVNRLTETPDVIFLDFYLEEELNGLDILKKIKNLNPKIPVVIVTGQESIAATLDTMKHGAFDYVKKDNASWEKLDRVIWKLMQLKANKQAAA